MFDLIAIMKLTPELQNIKNTCDRFTSIENNIIQNVTAVCNNNSTSDDSYLDLIQNYGEIKTEVFDKNGSGKNC